MALSYGILFTCNRYKELIMSEYGIHSSPKEALEKYIIRLETIYLPWYEKASKTQFNKHSGFKNSIMLLGFLITFFAAISDMIEPEYKDLVKYLLIILPLLNNFIMTVSKETKSGELFSLRENAVVKLQFIIDKTKSEYSFAASDKDYKNILDTAIKELYTFDKDQANSYYRMTKHLPS